MTKTNPNKSILCINQTFDHNETAGIRMSRFVKYLPRDGWNIHLLHWDDEFTESMIPDEISRRVKTINYIDSTNFLDLSNSYLRQLRISHEIKKKIQQLVEIEAIDILLQSCPQFLPLINIKGISNTVDVPLVIDFRDSWTIRYGNSRRGISGAVLSTLRNAIEKRIFKYSDGIIMNTPRMERLYKEKYPSAVEKLVTITNGFDEELVPEESHSDSSQFQIIYPGRYRTAVASFLEGFKEFTERGYDAQFVYYGYPNTTFEANIRQLSIENNIDFRGYQNREIVFSAIKTSDIGLAVTRSDDQTQVPTKIYDYIGCNIPIICIDESDGGVREILDQFPNAYLIKPDETERMVSILAKIHCGEIQQVGERDMIEQYSRRELSRRLSMLLDNLAFSE